MDKKEIYKEIGVDETKLNNVFGEGNICVQLFGHGDYSDDEQNDSYTILNFMPRKERCCELEFDLKSPDNKKELEIILEDSIERMKIAAYIMQKQLNELMEKNKIETTFYYWEL